MLGCVDHILIAFNSVSCMGIYNFCVAIGGRCRILFFTCHGVFVACGTPYEETNW